MDIVVIILVTIKVGVVFFILYDTHNLIQDAKRIHEGCRKTLDSAEKHRKDAFQYLKKAEDLYYLRYDPNFAIEPGGDGI